MGIAIWSRRIVDNEWIILALLLPLVVFPGGATYLLLLVVPLLWILRKVAYGRLLIATPLDISILVLLFSVLISIFAANSLERGAPRIASLIYSIAVYYAAVAFAGRSWRRLVAGSIMLIGCGLFVVAVGIVGTDWGFGPLSPAKLLGSSLFEALFPTAPEGFNPNQVAGTLLWTVPLLLVAAVTSLWMGDRLMPGAGRRDRRIVAFLAFLAFLLMAGTLLLTRSRSALLALLYALLFIALVARRYSWPVVAGGMLALSLVVAVALLLFGGVAGQSFPGDLVSGDSNATDQAAPLADLQGRIEIWTRALYGIEDFPISGMGIGAFRRLAPVIYPFFLIPPDLDIGHAHNLFLQVALDLGLVGLIGYVAVWIGCGSMLWRSWRSAGDLRQRVLVLGFAGALVGFFVYGLSDAITIGAKPAFIFWLLLGLIAGQHALVEG